MLRSKKDSEWQLNSLFLFFENTGGWNLNYCKKNPKNQLLYRKSRRMYEKSTYHRPGSLQRFAVRSIHSTLRLHLSRTADFSNELLRGREGRTLIRCIANSIADTIQDRIGSIHLLNVNSVNGQFLLLWDLPIGNHGSCIHQLGMDADLDDSL